MSVKSYSLLLNSQNSRNFIINTNGNDVYSVNWDNIFKSEPATHFLVQFEFTSLSFANNLHFEPILLSLNLPTHHHYNQNGSPSSVMGVINLVNYANSKDVFKANVSDNFPITVQRPTNSELVLKFLELDEELVSESTPQYIIIIKFTPVQP